jgi:hypothetical protein
MYEEFEIVTPWMRDRAVVRCRQSKNASGSRFYKSEDRAQ